MPRYTQFFPAVAAYLFVSGLAAHAVEPPVADWLRGSGKDLQLCLHGEVVDSDGRPAKDFQLTGDLNATLSREPLKPQIDGNHFKLWANVNRPHWFSIGLSAASANGEQVAYRSLNDYQVRQAAIEGIKLTLQRPTRQVNVKVADQGKPVAGANVKVELEFNVELRATTDADGVAHVRLLPQQTLSRFTAWTDDHRIGGFSFGRTPVRDPDTNEQRVELSKCREQKIRFLAEDGTPVPDVTFMLQVATPPPNYNFIGTMDAFRMTTDATGEAICKWFPDWKEAHYYVDIQERPWILDGNVKNEDGVAVFHLKKSKPRKQIVGIVDPTGTETGAGGFFVELRSFQGEREHTSDITSAFSDANGIFTIDVLPDAAYCAHVDDARWVGAMIDLVPYESATDIVHAPELSIAEGQPIEVIVTTGPNKRPLANLAVCFRREHDYTWFENGEKKHGTGSSDSWVTTDEMGVAKSRTLPGKQSASVYTPRWRAEETVDVVAGQPTTIKLHREVDEKQKVTGRVVLAGGTKGSVKSATVSACAADGHSVEQLSTECKPDGSFAFESYTATLGIFARTEDGAAAGSLVTSNLSAPIEVRLQPTLEYQGQLLGSEDRPLVGRNIVGTVRVEVDKSRRILIRQGFESIHLSAVTDEKGNFTIRRVPAQMAVTLSVEATDGSVNNVFLDEFRLEPTETRPRTVLRIGAPKNTAAKKPLAERFQTTLRDCALNGYRLLMVLSDDSNTVEKFVNQNYVSSDTNQELYPFMQLVVAAKKDQLKPEDTALLQSHDWVLPLAGHVAAIVMDGEGKELGRQDIDVNIAGAAEQVAKFIHQYVPATPDAGDKWTAAFAEAEHTGRRVWVRVSQRYCGPCFRLTRWLDDQQKLLEKDYVMLKIDDFHDLRGNEIAQRVTRGGEFGIPFHAIFDASGKMLVDSAGPLGNVGFPSGFDGKKQLRKMLQSSRQNLTDAEIDQLVQSIPD